MFRDHDRLRICLLDCRAEITPELMVHPGAPPQICRHIQPPAICSKRRRHPFFRNPQNVLVQFRRFFVIELRKRRVSPPAIVAVIKRPGIFIVELEKIAIRAVLRDICPLRIAARVLVQKFRIQPFIERTTMVEHTVHQHPDSPLVCFLNQAGKKGITRLQVLLIRRPRHIFMCAVIVRIFRTHQPVCVLQNHSIMRIDMVVVLTVILMVRR